MKRNIIIVSLLLTNMMQIKSMEKPENRDNSPWIQKGDFRYLRVMQIPDNDGEQDEIKTPKQEEVFDHYFCAPLVSEPYDDAQQLAIIKQSLFIQLCVQASKMSVNQAPQFGALLKKLRDREINVTADPITVSKKDLCYRLLTCIPTGHSHSLVNGKAIKMALSAYETEQDKQENERIRKCVPTQTKQWQWGESIDPLPLTYSGASLYANYYFEEDKEHHEKVLAQFNELLKKN